MLPLLESSSWLYSFPSQMFLICQSYLCNFPWSLVLLSERYFPLESMAKSGCFWLFEVNTPNSSHFLITPCSLCMIHEGYSNLYSPLVWSLGKCCDLQTNASKDSCEINGQRQENMSNKGFARVGINWTLDAVSVSRGPLCLEFGQFYQCSVTHCTIRIKSLK